jgi:hypothetical protein
MVRKKSLSGVELCAEADFGVVEILRLRLLWSYSE